MSQNFGNGIVATGGFILIFIEFFKSLNGISSIEEVIGLICGSVFIYLIFLLVGTRK